MIDALLLLALPLLPVAAVGLGMALMDRRATREIREGVKRWQ